MNNKINKNETVVQEGRPISNGVRNYLVFTLILGILYLCGCPKPEPPKTEVKPVTLGAFYFPDGPAKDCLRQKLTPSQEPVLGNYDIRKPDVIKQHLVWANQSGISFFAVNWYGPETPSDNTIKKHLAPALTKEKSPTKFCVTYLTPFLHNTLNYEIVLDQPNDALFVKNMLYLARTYFNHPNYFRLNNRPVVFLYLSRFLKGDYAKTFSRLREIIRQATKDDIYLIGDEVFWTEPDEARIRQMDAISVYTMYGPERYAGYAEMSGFLKDIDEVFSKYRKLVQEIKIGFVPNVMPGFNDRGVPKEKRMLFQTQHYVIPRIFALDNKDEGSFYRFYFQTARRHLDPQLNLLLINSWNGWRDDTQIEPVKVSGKPATQPRDLTSGYEYPPYGELYLTITKESGK